MDYIDGNVMFWYKKSKWYFILDQYEMNYEIKFISSLSIDHFTIDIESIGKKIYKITVKLIMGFTKNYYYFFNKMNENINPKFEKKDIVEKNTLEAVRKHFKPEFINRLDGIVYFKRLKKEDMIKIIEIQISKLESRLSERNIKLSIPKSVKEFLVDMGFDEKYGARPLRRSIQQHLEDPLSEELLSGLIKDGSNVKAKLDKKSNKLIFTSSNSNSITSEPE